MTTIRLAASVFVLLAILTGTVMAEPMTAEQHQAALQPLLEKMDKVNTTGPFQPTVESLEKYTVPEWYKDAKFGIFIHYGVFSVPGFAGLGCWYGNGMYTKDSPTWKFHRETYGPQDNSAIKTSRRC